MRFLHQIKWFSLQFHNKLSKFTNNTSAASPTCCMSSIYFNCTTIYTFLHFFVLPVSFLRSVEISISCECFLAGNTPSLILRDKLCTRFLRVKEIGKWFDCLPCTPPTRTAFLDPFFLFRRWTDDGWTLIRFFYALRTAEIVEARFSRWNCGALNLHNALEICFGQLFQPFAELRNTIK